MKIIRQKRGGTEGQEDLQTIALKVDRFKLLKRRWRGVANDGAEFGFELDAALKDGDCFFRVEGKRYVIQQESEAVLEVDFTERLFEGLHLAWSIGNLHMPMQSLASGVRVADDPAIRQLFAHLGIHFHEKQAVFQPIKNSTDIGHTHSHSHAHDHGHAHDHEHTHPHTH